MHLDFYVFINVLSVIGVCFWGAVWLIGKFKLPPSLLFSFGMIATSVSRYVPIPERPQSNLQVNVVFDNLVKAGNFNWVDFSITPENFPVEFMPDLKGSERIFYFGRRPVREDEVIERMKKAGCRPATFAEALAYNAKYPEDIELHALIALGTEPIRVGRCTFIPILSRGELGRQITLEHTGLYVTWGGRQIFLGVRIVP